MDWRHGILDARAGRPHVVREAAVGRGIIDNSLGGPSAVSAESIRRALGA